MFHAVTHALFFLQGIRRSQTPQGCGKKAVISVLESRGNKTQVWLRQTRGRQGLLPGDSGFRINFTNTEGKCQQTTVQDGDRAWPLLSGRLSPRGNEEPGRALRYRWVAVLCWPPPPPSLFDTTLSHSLVDESPSYRTTPPPCKSTVVLPPGRRDAPSW